MRWIAMVGVCDASRHCGAFHRQLPPCRRPCRRRRRPRDLVLPHPLICAEPSCTSTPGGQARAQPHGGGDGSGAAAAARTQGPGGLAQNQGVRQPRGFGLGAQQRRSCGGQPCSHAGRGDGGLTGEGQDSESMHPLFIHGSLGGTDYYCPDHSVCGLALFGEPPISTLSLLIIKFMFPRPPLLITVNMLQCLMFCDWNRVVQSEVADWSRAPFSIQLGRTALLPGAAQAAPEAAGLGGARQPELRAT